MRVRFGARRLTTPAGAQWRVGRRWARRSLPRWRRVRVRRAAEEAADGVWAVPDVGSLDDLGLALAAFVAVLVLAVVVIPLLLFGVEIIIGGLVLAAGVLASSLLGRPWIVQAVPAGGAEALTWEVKGWRRSSRVIDEVVSALAAGLSPAPGEEIIPR